jgi:hypothetical protein
MELVRTFHPVGHGAFYCERHECDGQKFTVVYDCGGYKIKSRIEAEFPLNSIIDVLFISHFHRDHVNGLEYLKKHCKIKRVVMPYVNNNALIILKSCNYVSGNSLVVKRLLDCVEHQNVNKFFGEKTEIIMIDGGFDGNISEEIISFDNDNNKDHFKSGTQFTFHNSEWFFIPFNHDNKDRMQEFEEALKLQSLTLSDIDSPDKIKKHRTEIKKAYEAINKDMNVHSMILFSGSNEEDYIKRMNNNCCFCCQKKLRSSCLYTGDIDKPKDIFEIEEKLKKANFRIGTIQIPHHGSILNFDKSILNKDMRCAVISHKSQHPVNEGIKNDISSKGMCLYSVTECVQSILIQKK